MTLIARSTVLLLLPLFLAYCAQDEVHPSELLQKSIESKDNPRESVRDLVADAKERLMEPYLLGGEDVGALYIRTEIAFHQNSDAELLRQLHEVGPDAGHLYYFLERSKPGIARRKASVAFIEAHKPPASGLPALNVEG